MKWFPFKKDVDFRGYVDGFLRQARGVSDPVDEEKNTLLHLAVIENAHDTLGLLLRLGIDFKKKNLYGHTAFDLVRFLQRDAFFSIFQKEKDDEIVYYAQGQKESKSLNVKETQSLFKFSYINHLEFSDYSYLRWTLKKTQERLKKPSIVKGNKWNHALFHRELALKKMPKLSIRWVGPLVGHGIYAEEDIAALSYVGEYAGVVRKRHKRSDKENHFVFGYVIGPHDTPFVIDAKERGNLTRFINHSDAPNLTSRWMIFGGISHIILFSNQFIPKGTQLTYDYGPVYWRSRFSPLDL